jgi:hypothetical protein
MVLPFPKLLYAFWSVSLLLTGPDNFSLLTGINMQATNALSIEEVNTMLRS